jgi:hypothetical protein
VHRNEIICAIPHCGKDGRSAIEIRSEANARGICDRDGNASALDIGLPGGTREADGAGEELAGAHARSGHERRVVEAPQADLLPIAPLGSMPQNRWHVKRRRIGTPHILIYPFDPTFRVTAP